MVCDTLGFFLSPLVEIWRLMDNHSDSLEIQCYRDMNWCLPSHRILGTPNEEVWPTVSTLPDYKPTFPQWSSQDLGRIVATLDEVGLDFLKVCPGNLCVRKSSSWVLRSFFMQRALVYDSAKRISGMHFCSKFNCDSGTDLIIFCSETCSSASLLRGLQAPSRIVQWIPLPVIDDQAWEYPCFVYRFPKFKIMPCHFVHTSITELAIDDWNVYAFSPLIFSNLRAFMKYSYDPVNYPEFRFHF